MKKDDLMPYLNHKVKIFLDDNFQYTGFVEAISEDTLVLKDKFNQKVSISFKSINIITSFSEQGWHQ